MEEILEKILQETNSDRVILYNIEDSTTFASQRTLFHLRPQVIVSTELAESLHPREEIYKSSYPYYIFVDAIRILYDEGLFSFIPRIDNRVSQACAIGLENISKEAGSKSLNYFLIDDTHLISIHHCKIATLVKRAYLTKYLEILKKILCKRSVKSLSSR